MKRVNFTIPDEFDGYTVDSFLRKNGVSRNLITHLKQTDMGISIDDKLIFTNYKLTSGQVLSIKVIDEAPSENIIPVNLPVDIVYEDEDIIVINKPFDMPCHPSKGNYENTLGNALAYKFRDTPFVFRSVSRLDRDTTGLLVVAKHMFSAAILSNMVKERKIKREYLAICSGITPINGTIEAPIIRAYEGTIERIVDFSRGEHAVTHFQRIKNNEKHSLMHIKLETGRTHQIRVHMKHIGFPLIGDFLYNPDYAHITRQALHSWKLSFVHPISKQQMNFEVKPPQDMQQVLAL